MVITTPTICPGRAERSPGTATGAETRQPNVNKPRRTPRKLLNFQRPVASAPRSGRGGRRFKSCHSDHYLAENSKHSATPCATPCKYVVVATCARCRGRVAERSIGGCLRTMSQAAGAVGSDFWRQTHHQEPRGVSGLSQFQPHWPFSLAGDSTRRRSPNQMERKVGPASLTRSDCPVQ
jgi:hypothetical protein